jgi:hypothetical protein
MHLETFKTSHVKIEVKKPIFRKTVEILQDFQNNRKIMVIIDEDLLEIDSLLKIINCHCFAPDPEA